MLTINKVVDNDKVTLYPAGRIDSAGSDILQSQILEAWKSCRELTIDFEEVKYISSAGLRALLISHKTAASKGGKMVIKNCNKEVMEVIRSVGFDKILDIE